MGLLSALSQLSLFSWSNFDWCLLPMSPACGESWVVPRDGGWDVSTQTKEEEYPRKKGNMGKMLAVEMNNLFAGTVRETVVLVFGFNYEQYEIRPGQRSWLCPCLETFEFQSEEFQQSVSLFSRNHLWLWAGGVTGNQHFTDIKLAEVFLVDLSGEVQRQEM